VKLEFHLFENALVAAEAYRRCSIMHQS